MKYLNFIQVIDISMLKAKPYNQDFSLKTNTTSKTPNNGYFLLLFEGIIYRLPFLTKSKEDNRGMTGGVKKISPSAF